jgi:hypothetical protein
MCDNPSMNRTLSVVVVGALMLLGCGSDETTEATTPALGSPADAATGPPPTEVPVATAPAAPLTPRVVCQGNNAEIYFGYTNESSEPVVVPEGDDNRLTGVAPDDNPFVTTLFAPGDVEMAFWAFPVEGATEDIVWTLTGPDGVERAASGGLETERCPSDFLADVADRVPTLELGDVALAADGQTADVQLRVTGVDETSVCNEAFTAEPALLTINEGAALPTGFEPEATFTLGPFEDGPDGTRVANTRAYVLALDQCAGAGVTASSWFPAPVVDIQPTFGTAVCATVDETGTLTVSLSPGLCGGLGGTGGSSVRPR